MQSHPMSIDQQQWEGVEGGGGGFQSIGWLLVTLQFPWSKETVVEHYPMRKKRYLEEESRLCAPIWGGALLWVDEFVLFRSCSQWVWWVDLQGQAAACQTVSLLEPSQCIHQCCSPCRTLPFLWGDPCKNFQCSSHQNREPWTRLSRALLPWSIILPLWCLDRCFGWAIKTFLGWSSPLGLTLHRESLWQLSADVRRILIRCRVSQRTLRRWVACQLPCKRSGKSAHRRWALSQLLGSMLGTAPISGGPNLSHNSLLLTKWSIHHWLHHPQFFPRHPSIWSQSQTWHRPNCYSLSGAYQMGWSLRVPIQWPSNLGIQWLGRMEQ